MLPTARFTMIKAASHVSRRSLASLNSSPAPRVNKDRLWTDIQHVAQWGRGDRWGKGEHDVGMSRLALSDNDRHARDWFKDTTRSLGCEVKIDEMGNMFAVRKGRQDGAPTYAGSHLDTQPTGGRYDGILGVCAGIEVLRALKDEGYDSEFPIGVVNWTNEEGARFPISMISSGVWAGSIPLQRAHELQEVGTCEPKTMKEELQRIDYMGGLKAGYDANPIGAHFELHIEQGPRLEANQQRIGVVTGVQAYRWYTIEVTGRDCHTGTTDFVNRSDAMLTASKLIVHSHRVAAKHKSLASTGILTLKPGSTNTVPGKVRFSLDVRATLDETVINMEEELKKDFQAIASEMPVSNLNEGGTLGKGCTVEWTMDSDSPATHFDKHCIQCIESSAQDLFGSEPGRLIQQMVSGAGHDSVYTSRRTPTAMIFVPCREGISHNPAEYCAPEDCANGAQVLAGAMVRYDRLRKI